MNPKLHEKWNAERDTSRGSSKEGQEILEITLKENKVLLTQNKPR